MWNKIIFILGFVLMTSVSFSQEYQGILPFSVVESTPVFPGCEKMRSKYEIKKCFMGAMLNHIKVNFKYPKEAIEKKLQGRVLVTFEINKEGKVVRIRSRGNNELLENEAKRIVSLLPKMEPGIQNGNPIRVEFSVPITFRL